MYRPTMSVRAMLGVVAFFAVASVALVRASDIWVSLTFTAALGVISLALLAAILRRGAKQAFWIGFALFGWLYLWMAHWRGDPDVQFGPHPGSWRLQQDETGTLATTKFLVYAYNHWLPAVRKPPQAPTAPTTLPPALVVIEYPLLHEFMRVGHSLFIVILALVGGIAANYLYKTRDRDAA